MRFGNLLFILIFVLAGCRTMHPTKEGASCCTMDAKSAAKPEVREVYATDLAFDGPKGVIEYTLPEPALVRINIGIRDGGPLLRTLLDWEYRDKGLQTEVWDKKDASGQTDIGNRNDLLVVLKCISLDSNKQFAPKVHLTFPESSASKDGVPVLTGITPARLTLDEKDREWLAANKYELGLYIDHVFLMEEEEGTNPFTYRLDTTKLNSGVHTVTVNLVAYRGDTSTESKQIYIENQP